MAAALIPQCYELLFVLLGGILVIGGVVAAAVTFTGMFYKLG